MICPKCKTGMLRVQDTRTKRLHRELRRPYAVGFPLFRGRTCDACSYEVVTVEVEYTGTKGCGPLLSRRLYKAAAFLERELANVLKTLEPKEVT